MHLESPDSDLPVGFTSFSQDLLPNETSKHATAYAQQDISFAESIKEENDAAIPEQALDFDQSESFVRKREMKLSSKKSDLYLQIMREHGIDEDELEKKLSTQKMAYVIPDLNETKTEVKQVKSLTTTMPFDFQTAKRIKVLDEVERQPAYEPLSQQLVKNFQLRVSEKMPDRPRKLT